MHWAKDIFFCAFVGLVCAFFAYFIFEVPINGLIIIFIVGFIAGLILEYLMNRFDEGRTALPMFFSGIFVIGIGFFIFFPIIFGVNSEAMEIPRSISPIIKGEPGTTLTQITTVTPIEYYTRNYQWSYGGSRQTYTLRIPTSLYAYYKEQPHDRNYAKYAISEIDRKSLDRITGTFKNSSVSETKAAYNIIAFVQSLPYSKDYVTTGYDEYPRYPIETLVDGTGDCEDTAILTAALLKEMKYDVVLISPPGHMAVGITCSDCSGTSFSYNNKKYYYLETTGKNWKVGQIPEEYQNTKAKIYPI